MKKLSQEQKHSQTPTPADRRPSTNSSHPPNFFLYVFSADPYTPDSTSCWLTSTLSGITHPCFELATPIWLVDFVWFGTIINNNMTDELSETFVEVLADCFCRCLHADR